MWLTAPLTLAKLSLNVTEGVQAIPNGSAWVPAKGRYMVRFAESIVTMDWEVYNSGDATWYDMISDIKTNILDNPPWLVTDGANARFISTGASGTSNVTWQAF